MVTLGNVLPRVLVASVPSGLGSRESACEAVASGLEIEDGVDSVAAATHADHDCVLIRAHDVGDVIKHSLFRELLNEGPL